MIQSPSFLITIVAFALVIGPLVFLHEMGHYLAARLFGVKAEEFSIGFGTELFGITDRRGTRWKFGLLPLGGYVRFAGDMDASSRTDPAWLEMPAEERARTFPAKPLWQRAIIVAAGPIMNFLIAIVIIAGFAIAFGESHARPLVGMVEPGSPAAVAGLQPGDRITSLGGRPVEDFQDMVTYVRLRPGEDVTIGYERNGAAGTLTAKIADHSERDRFGNTFHIGRLGIAPDRSGVRLEPVNPLAAPAIAVRKVGSYVGMMGDVVGQIVTGHRSVKDLGGPVQIARVSGQQFTLGLEAFVAFIASVSINLAVINLLPLPVLDGGHLLFYAIEAIQRRPVNGKVMEWAFRGGLAAVLALMLMVTINDLGSLGLWSKLAGLIG